MPYPLVNSRISRLSPGAMVIIALCFIITGLPAQELNDKQQAFSLAGELNRPVLMVFAGSDWCALCIRFNKEILKDTGFIHFASENLVILVAEFPQKKKLSPELIKQNEDLAERYNPSGLFPHLLLLNSGGEVITILDHRSKSPEEFAGQISKHLAGKPALQEFKTRTTLMGCTFEFTIVDSAHSDHGWLMIKRSIEEVQRI